MNPYELAMMDSVAYRKRAELHRPTSIEELRREVVRLAADGLRVRDIASSLRLDLAVVINLLAGKRP
jgi:DNA-binding NarL/FixJ family response regulator